MVWESCRCLLANSKQAVVMSFTEECLLSGHSIINAWLMECCRGCCPSGRFSHLHRGTLELCQSDHRARGQPPDKEPSPRLLSLAGWQALARVLVVPNFFHLRMMEATVFLGTFNAAELFWYPSPDLFTRHNPVSELYGQFLWPHGLVLVWHALSTMGPYI